MAGEQRLRRGESRERQLEGHRARLQRLRQRAVPLEFRRTARERRAVGHHRHVAVSRARQLADLNQPGASPTSTTCASRYGKGRDDRRGRHGAATRPPPARRFSRIIIARTRNAGALGVLCWEPQAYNWQGYTKGSVEHERAAHDRARRIHRRQHTPPAAAASRCRKTSTGFCGVDGTVDSNNAGYTGTGFANTNNAPNAGVRWRVNATAAGNFTLQWRFANGTTGNRPGSLRVNGTTLSTVALPATGAWTTWTNSASVTARRCELAPMTSRWWPPPAAAWRTIDSLTVTGRAASAHGVQLQLEGAGHLRGSAPLTRHAQRACWCARSRCAIERAMQRSLNTGRAG